MLADSHRIRQLREARPWTQEELAEASGTTPRTVQRIEAGKGARVDTLRALASALGVDFRQLVLPDTPNLRNEDAVYRSIHDAATGLYGTQLGVSQFFRNLPGNTLQSAVQDAKLLWWVTFHAALIVDGDSDRPIEEDRIDADVLRNIRMLLIAEHFRRIGFLRLRYPRDPFIGEPQLAWWTGHPFVELLYAQPPEHQMKLKGVLLRTGDLSVLIAYFSILPEPEQESLMDRVKNFDEHLPQFLEYIEQEYKDAETLAWKELIPAGPLTYRGKPLP